MYAFKLPLRHSEEVCGMHGTPKQMLITLSFILFIAVITQGHCHLGNLPCLSYPSFESTQLTLSNVRKHEVVLELQLWIHVIKFVFELKSYSVVSSLSGLLD